ncbi:hypothetical protein NKI94_24540 [Mesorhizobium australicum]|uniref:hypothetical protein n=1 Tax=Mesorhizobium australicum TaxID=536018 RepID=UPI003334DE1C
MQDVSDMGSISATICRALACVLLVCNPAIAVAGGEGVLEKSTPIVPGDVSGDEQNDDCDKEKLKACKIEAKKELASCKFSLTTNCKDTAIVEYVECKSEAACK